MHINGKNHFNTKDRAKKRWEKVISNTGKYNPNKMIGRRDDFQSFIGVNLNALYAMYNFTICDMGFCVFFFLFFFLCKRNQNWQIYWIILASVILENRFHKRNRQCRHNSIDAIHIHIHAAGKQIDKQPIIKTIQLRNWMRFFCFSFFFFNRIATNAWILMNRWLTDAPPHFLKCRKTNQLEKLHQ